MNTIICNQGYIISKNILSESNIRKIKNELSVKPFIMGNRSHMAKTFKIYRENDEKFCLPKYYGIKNFGNPDLTDFNQSKEIDLSFNGDLRDYQKKVVDTVIPKIKNQEGGTISLPPGRGKTVIACNIISKLKTKTLVIVHKTFLLNQWKNRIEFFLPNSKVGIIQGKTIDVDNKDIVIGMLQTLSLKDDYPDDIFDDFGCIIFDECHHLSAEKFSQILRKISLRYMIGLSGTPFRNDKLEKVFDYHIGEIMYYEKPQVNQDILVEIHKYSIDHEKFKIILNKYTKEAQISTMITNITEINQRSDYIISLIKKCREDLNRKILILSDRLDHLDYMLNKVKELDIGTSDKYIGGMKQEKLDIAEQADIIFSTYSMSSEALDISSLNTIILSTSRKNVEQSVGRILRNQKGNYLSQPLIIDIVDDIRTFINQGYSRKSYYKKITNVENIVNYKNGKKETKSLKKIEEKENTIFIDSDSD